MDVRILTLSLPMVCAQTNDESYFAATWVLLTFVLLMYITLITMTFPYSHPRGVPIVLFIFFAFFPPFFFLFLVWLFFMALLFPLQIQQQAIEERSSSRRQVGGRT